MTQLDIFNISSGYKVLDILIDRATPLSMLDLCYHTDMTDRDVRSEIKAIRNDDSIPYIIQSGAKGYWIGKRGEFNHMLHARGLSSMETDIRVNGKKAMFAYYWKLHELMKQTVAEDGQLEMMFTHDGLHTVKKYIDNDM